MRFAIASYARRLMPGLRGRPGLEIKLHHLIDGKRAAGFATPAFDDGLPFRQFLHRRFPAVAPGHHLPHQRAEVTLETDRIVLGKKHRPKPRDWATVLETR